MQAEVAPVARATRKLALCFDGTWNTYKSHTNVSRCFEAVADQTSNCGEQLKFYDEGVGTTWGTRVTGAAYGAGLSRNILIGYCWLINTYEPGNLGVQVGAPDPEQFSLGDKIYLFWFSRGAFTARSLAGLINRCGILKRDQFPGERATPESRLVREAWESYREKALARDSPTMAAFRAHSAHNVLIKMVGVWDTVALSVPSFVTAGLPLSGALTGFHDTKLGRTIEHARHAIAIDENRKDYQVAMWTEKHAATKSIEQRWFPGAHADVGGAYVTDAVRRARKQRTSLCVKAKQHLDRSSNQRGEENGDAQQK